MAPAAQKNSKTKPAQDLFVGPTISIPVIKRLFIAFELNELRDTNEGMYFVVIKHLNTMYLKMR